MLRIHFTAPDLARTRVASAPALMWETVLSTHWLQDGCAGLLGMWWRGRVRPNLPRRARSLAELIPNQGYFPDFLTPHTATLCLAEAVEPVLLTPRNEVRKDIELLATGRPLSPWVRDLHRGLAPALAHLDQSFRDYQRLAITPFLGTISTHTARERARAGRLLASGGVEALLRGLSPSARWRAPVLGIDYPVDRDLHLDGRGLLLVPSYFCRCHPVTLVRQGEETPVLLYPLGHEPWDSEAADDTRETLANLVGCSRAAVLEAAGECRQSNTSQLARRAGLRLSSASEHLTVLRRAGLIVSSREGGSVLHEVTPLGAGLLHRHV
ncbi:helix-turn-helix transcriptional regulator [Streptomyces sp. MZ04]|uniref:ArsR/SmtB family transcription factor n=1 Tax=Streptomyces sp. MZ04 TaxID=2559236 RepID=UPI00107EE7D6|nr:helix-turn-helix transcriptional regulator [Streptomyces sp. MZ04]TGB06987.1 transcriptional regulator [Streptomyces sp. MZ04]